MTTLLALRKDGVSYLASDTQAQNGERIVSLSRSKIFSWGRFALSFCGPNRLLSLVENYDGPRDEDSPWKVSQKLRELMLADGWISSADSQTGERLFGISGFIAGPDDVHLMCGGLSLVKLEEGVPLGRGSGAEAAQAAALTALFLGQPPHRSLMLGVAAARTYDVYSGGHCAIWQVLPDTTQFFDRNPLMVLR